MKRRLLLFLLLALLCAAAVGAWKYRARLFHCHEVSQLYALYEQHPGVEADFIRNMRIDDTTIVDVTVLHAVDSTAWACLTADFGVPPATDYECHTADQGRDVTRLLRYNGSPVADSAALPPVVAVALARQTVSVFHVDTQQQKHAILHYNFDKSQTII